MGLPKWLKQMVNPNLVLSQSRSSHRRCSMKLGETSNFIKKILSHWCFPVNFAKILRTTFLQNTSGWLLLKILISIKAHVLHNVSKIFLCWINSTEEPSSENEEIFGYFVKCVFILGKSRIFNKFFKFQSNWILCQNYQTTVTLELPFVKHVKDILKLPPNMTSFSKLKDLRKFQLTNKVCNVSDSQKN